MDPRSEFAAVADSLFTDFILTNIRLSLVAGELRRTNNVAIVSHAQIVPSVMLDIIALMNRAVAAQFRAMLAYAMIGLTGGERCLLRTGCLAFIGATSRCCSGTPKFVKTIVYQVIYPVLPPCDEYDVKLWCFFCPSEDQPLCRLITQREPDQPSMPAILLQLLSWRPYCPSGTTIHAALATFHQPCMFAAQLRSVPGNRFVLKSIEHLTESKIKTPRHTAPPAWRNKIGVLL